MGFIDGKNEFPGHLTNILKIFDTISLVLMNRLTKNVFSHPGGRIFNDLSVRCQVFHRSVQGNSIEVAIPRLWV